MDHRSKEVINILANKIDTPPISINYFALKLLAIIFQHGLAKLMFKKQLLGLCHNRIRFYENKTVMLL